MIFFAPCYGIYGFTVISFHSQIVPSQIVPINSQIVPQNSQFVPQKSQFVPHVKSLQPFINILFACGDVSVVLMTPAPKQHTELHKITKTSSR